MANPVVRQRLRQKLEQEKSQIEKRLKQNDSYGMDQSMNGSIGELSGYDNHPADLGTEIFERGKDLALNENDERRLKEIDKALERMDQGTYGICKVCGQEIAEDRLEAVPTAEYCVHHHPEQHSSIRRPAEEKVMDPGGHNQDQSDKNFYDGEDAWQDVEQYGTSNPPDFFVEGRNYNELTVDSHEHRGYVDLTEGFSITDLSGETGEITEITHNDAYAQKEREERKNDPLS
ncbi:TraR/DksA C4-type zinc finger protein [Thermoactinomyces intermedius]|uniref:TraR/DksA C4-type zinc finger protein n=1 Tax=Thermoactinomyces intermedius TaxID=2024 RepID=A0A8I1AAD2_THEIN|nr:TraR/DksA C4-type zinc finger protein [Thermoactinomyces intermedius]MBA4547538.1 TraR/DksA C4-type zinc finger protein [Thermoactinomyces intermedius]MBA4837777.1 TraR/DksA C4-type zinc finger protein [Thermoactinomyces intermedius]MBH8594232.1 TraR/DksA C4-type zinc finger protein [Thermoactinomyces intermedius]